MKTDHRLKLHSIIVPVYNSASIISHLVQRVEEVLQRAGINFELILVDDGSHDGSFEEILRLSSMYPFIRGYRLSRNFGHQAALNIGLQKCRGHYVAITDDDLQDPPEILISFFDRLYDDADVVYGIRKKRKETFLKRFCFNTYYRILRAMSSVNIPVDAGDFCAMRRSVVNAMLQMPLAQIFLRGTRAWAGFRQVGVEYERSERFDGHSGYTLGKYLELASVGIMLFSAIPLRIATWLGVLVTLLVSLYVIGIIVYWLMFPFEVPGYLSIIVIMIFLGGTQLLCLGIMGEYLRYIHENVRRWPVAFVAETTEGDQE